jgi:hypothetical protein
MGPSTGSFRTQGIPGWTSRPRPWCADLGIPFHEAKIETNGHDVSLVFSDLDVDRVAPGHSPVRRSDRRPRRKDPAVLTPGSAADSKAGQPMSGYRSSRPGSCEHQPCG